MVFLMQLTVPSAVTQQLLLSAKPNPLKTERLENNLHLCGGELADKLEILFPNRGDEGVCIIPALDTRSHVLSIKDRRNGIGKPVFKLASLGSGQTFTLVAHDLSVPGVPPDVLQRVLSLKPTRPMCDGRTPRLSAFSPPGGLRRLFRCFPVPMG